MRLRIAITLLSFTLPNLSFAECSWNFNHTFYGCDTFGLSEGVGRSVPLVSNIIDFNPGSLPSLPTPVGLEATYSSKPNPLTGSRLETSIIKGFNGIGFGLGTWNPGTFSSADLQDFLLASAQNSTTQGNLLQAQSYAAAVTSLHQGFQFGTAVDLPTGPAHDLVRVSLGASFGELGGANSLSSNYGLSAEMSVFDFGYSTQQVRVQTLPAIDSHVLTGGAHLFGLYFAYSKTTWNTGVLPANTLYSIRYGSTEWTAFGAVKNYTDAAGFAHSWTSVSLQRNLGAITIGYLYGLYLHSQSIDLQYFF